MIVADELEADWSQIRVKQAPAGDSYKSPVFGAQVTVGSASVRGFYEPLRKAGAAGRMMLVRPQPTPGRYRKGSARPPRVW